MMSDDNSCLVGFFYRDNNTWAVVNATKFGKGKNWQESEELIKSNLKMAGLDDGMLLESKAWKSDSGKKFKLEKDSILLIP